MTYEDLRQYLDTLDDDQLNDDVTVYIRDREDYYRASNISAVKGSCDVLHKNHVYLIVS